MYGNNLCCKVDCRDGKKVRKRDLGVLGQNPTFVAKVSLPKRTFDCDSCCLFVPPWLCQDFRFCLPAPLFRLTKAILSSLPGPGYPCHLRLVPVGADGFCSAQAGYLPDVLSFPFPVFSSFSRSFPACQKIRAYKCPGSTMCTPGAMRLRTSVPAFCHPDSLAFPPIAALAAAAWSCFRRFSLSLLFLSLYSAASALLDVDEVPELLAPGGVTELSKSLGLDLADPLSGDAEDLSHLLEGMGLSAV